MQLLFKLRKLVTTWMDLEGIMLSKMSETEKDKYVPHLYMESEKKNQNTKTNQTKTANS